MRQRLKRWIKHIFSHPFKLWCFINSVPKSWSTCSVVTKVHYKWTCINNSCWIKNILIGLFLRINLKENISYKDLITKISNRNQFKKLFIFEKMETRKKNTLWILNKFDWQKKNYYVRFKKWILFTILNSLKSLVKKPIFII